MLKNVFNEKKADYIKKFIDVELSKLFNTLQSNYKILNIGVLS